MTKTDIIVCIYSAHRPGVPGDRGPSGLPQYVGVAGVSGLNCRPEFFGVSRNIPSDDGEVVIDKEIGGIGSPPYRKRVTIALPDHVHYGSYEFSGLHMNGLYSDHKASDGMGPCVGVWCRTSVVFEDGNYEAAIDAAISSGIVLYVPTKEGGRENVNADILSVSHIFGDNFSS